MGESKTRRGDSVKMETVMYAIIEFKDDVQRKTEFKLATRCDECYLDVRSLVLSCYAAAPDMIKQLHLLFDFVAHRGVLRALSDYKEVARRQHEDERKRRLARRRYRNRAHSPDSLQRRGLCQATDSTVALLRDLGSTAVYADGNYIWIALKKFPFSRLFYLFPPPRLPHDPWIGQFLTHGLYTLHCLLQNGCEESDADVARPLCGSSASIVSVKLK